MTTRTALLKSGGSDEVVTDTRAWLLTDVIKGQVYQKEVEGNWEIIVGTCAHQELKYKYIDIPTQTYTHLSLNFK